MAESQITIRVDSDVLRRFKAACMLQGITPTKEYGRLLIERLESLEEENRQQPVEHQET